MQSTIHKTGASETGQLYEEITEKFINLLKTINLGKNLKKKEIESYKIDLKQGKGYLMCLKK